MMLRDEKNKQPNKHDSEDLDPRLRTSEGLAALLLSCSGGDEKDEEGGCFNRWKDVGKSSSWGRDLLLFWREGAEGAGRREGEVEGRDGPPDG